MDQNGNPKAF
jgi:hypothetical protein